MNDLFFLCLLHAAREQMQCLLIKLNCMLIFSNAHLEKRGQSFLSCLLSNRCGKKSPALKEAIFFSITGMLHRTLKVLIMQHINEYIDIIYLKGTVHIVEYINVNKQS